MLLLTLNSFPNHKLAGEWGMVDGVLDGQLINLVLRLQRLLAIDFVGGEGVAVGRRIECGRLIQTVRSSRPNLGISFDENQGYLIYKCLKIRYIY